MKAVVLESRDGYAAVLREDGTVEKIRRSCRVGETIELEDPGKVTRIQGRAVRWTAAAAAAVLLLSAGGTYGFNNAYAYSYVTLDANPSIEYTLNRRNRVIGVTALNEDGTAIAESLAADVRNGSLTEAVAETTALLYEEDYLEAGDSLLLNVTSRGEAQRQALNEELDAYFGGLEEELAVYVTSATREERESAEAMGISAGRYMVIREIAALDGGRGEPTRDEVDRLGGAAVGELLQAKDRAPASAAVTPEVPAASGEMEASAAAEPEAGVPVSAEPRAPENGEAEEIPAGPGAGGVPVSGASGEPSG